MHYSNGISKAELIGDLHERGVKFLCAETKESLVKKLEDEMAGVQETSVNVRFIRGSRLSAPIRGPTSGAVAHHHRTYQKSLPGTTLAFICKRKKEI